MQMLPPPGSGRRVLKYAIPVLLVLVIVGIVVRGRSNKGATRPQAHARTSAAVSEQPSGLTHTSASPVPAASSGTHHAVPGSAIDPALQQQVSTIVSSFYYWAPSLSTTERLRRIPAFTLDPSQLELYEPTPAYQAMARKHSLHILASVVTESLVGSPVPGEKGQFTVSGTAYLRFVNADASVYVENGAIYASREAFHSQWQKHASGEWYLVRFIDGGDTK